jgi:hypothetical protein
MTTYRRVFTDSSGESPFQEADIEFEEMDFVPPSPSPAWSLAIDHLERFHSRWVGTKGPRTCSTKLQQQRRGAAANNVAWRGGPRSNGGH